MATRMVFFGVCARGGLPLSGSRWHSSLGERALGCGRWSSALTEPFRLYGRSLVRVPLARFRLLRPSERRPDLFHLRDLPVLVSEHRLGGVGPLSELDFMSEGGCRASRKHREWTVQRTHCPIAFGARGKTSNEP